MRAVLSFIAVLIALSARPAAAEITLRIYAQSYTPEISTGDNPHPLHEFTRLARRFEALHPGVKIVFLKNPVGEYRTWMRTQLLGGTAPDIMWAHSTWTNEDARNGWFVNLDPYLARPNPYVPKGQPGSRCWGDLFYPDATNAKRGPDGHLYSLPIDQVETAIYYNRDLFDRAGVRPPRTWAEFIRVQQRLQRAGIVPFLMTGSTDMVTSWAKQILLDQLWADRLPLMDVRRSTQGGFPGVDQQEFVRAYRKGLFSVRDPRYREMLRLMKEWSHYWQPGFLAAQDDRLFRVGRVAMFWDGSWYSSQIQRDPMRTFRFGIFRVPPLTRESSPYAPAAPLDVRGVGGATSIQYAVTRMAVTSGHEKLAIDFLRFITAPAQLGPLVSEAGLFLPNVRGLPGHPTLAPFVPVLQAGHVRFSGEQTTPQYADQSFRMLQGYLGGHYSQEETVARLERYLARSVEETLRDNAVQWRFSSTGEILPPGQAHAPAHSESPARPWPFLALGAVAVVGLGLGVGHPALRRHRASYLFLVPTFSLLLLFSYYPIGSALYHAFTEWRSSGITTWVSAANFRELLSDDVLLESLGNTVKLLLAHIVIALTVPLLVAEMIFALRSQRAEYFYRVMFVVPMVVPGVVMLLIWGFFYDDNLGLLNQALTAIGLGHYRQSWLGDANLALYSLMFMGFPWVGGFPLLIYYAGLQSISPDVFDSARIDGAIGLHRFRHVDLPLLMGQVKLLLVLGFIGGLQGFQTQLLLTNGGPAYTTMVPGLHLYQNAIQFDRMGYACALGVVLFVVILGITYLNLRYLRSGQEYEP